MHILFSFLFNSCNDVSCIKLISYINQCYFLISSWKLGIFSEVPFIIPLSAPEAIYEIPLIIQVCHFALKYTPDIILFATVALSLSCIYQQPPKLLAPSIKMCKKKNTFAWIKSCTEQLPVFSQTTAKW